MLSLFWYLWLSVVLLFHFSWSEMIISCIVLCSIFFGSKLFSSSCILPCDARHFCVNFVYLLEKRGCNFEASLMHTSQKFDTRMWQFCSATICLNWVLFPVRTNQYILHAHSWDKTQPKIHSLYKLYKFFFVSIFLCENIPQGILNRFMLDAAIDLQPI